jgi:uncharacterized protein (DUF433 family)/DNA-binding transcriptional MerR regulator
MSGDQPQARPMRGALRTRVVSQLAGVSLPRLRYWHESLLIQAHAVPGRRGVPRLWSWEDYMKVRAAEKLSRAGLTTQRIRTVVEYLDDHVPDWFAAPLHPFGDSAVIDVAEGVLLADTGQWAMATIMTQMLTDLRDEGPLGELRRFSDHVDMDPSVIAGNPVAKGTRIETDFIAALVDRGVPEASIADSYGLSAEQVERVVEFSRAAA